MLSANRGAVNFADADEIEMLTRRIEKLEEEKQAFQDQADDFQRKIAKLEGHCSGLKTQVTQLKQNLKTGKNKSTQDQAQISSLFSRVNKLTRSEHSANMAINTLTKALDHAHSTVDNVTALYNNARQTLTELATKRVNSLVAAANATLPMVNANASKKRKVIASLANTGLFHKREVIEIDKEEISEKDRYVDLVSCNILSSDVKRLRTM
jgi:chromosome segregation ATPase